MKSLISRKHIVLLIIISLLCLTLQGCFPLVSNFSFVKIGDLIVTNQESGEFIPDVLVIPYYFTGTGGGLLEGQTTGKPGTSYLANPFIYSKGKKFEPKRATSVGVIFGPGLACIGHFDFLEGALILSPNHYAQWIDTLEALEIKCDMHLIPTAEKTSYIQSLLKELEKKEISTNIGLNWNGSKPLTMKMKLNKQQLSEVKLFLKDNDLPVK